MSKDTIYSLARERVGQFSFDQSVVDVFPDMIARSVPGYASILSMIEQLTARFAISSTQLYDLGCSLGAATRLMRVQAPADCLLHAIDNAPAMIQRLRQLLDADANVAGCQVRLVQSDVRDIEFSEASFVVLNLTLQFVPLSERPTLLQKIYDGLLPGGALLLSEKICFDDPLQQALLTELHHDFKRAHGYSDLEISQKRTAIENYLIPETIQVHCDRLRDVGFRQVVPWFQCFNFASILAVKL